MSQSSDIDFAPRNELLRMLKYGWLIAIAMLLGAALGAIFHRFQPPLYESKAEITVQIDYSRTGYFSDIEQDQVMETVGDYISSSEVKENAAKIAGWPDGQIENGDYLQQFFLERQNFRWVLRVRSPDAALSSASVNAWADQADRAISDGLEHAIIADGLENYMASLEKCLEQITLVEPVQAFCNFQNLAEIQNELKSTAPILKDERVLSKGLFSGISYHVSEKAATSGLLIQRGRNTYILAGLIIGLIMGILGISARLPECLMKRGS